MGVPQVIHLNRIFHYKPSSYGVTPHVWNLPNRYNLSWNITRLWQEQNKTVSHININMFYCMYIYIYI